MPSWKNGFKKTNNNSMSEMQFVSLIILIVEAFGSGRLPPSSR